MTQARRRRSPPKLLPKPRPLPRHSAKGGSGGTGRRRNAIRAAPRFRTDPLGSRRRKGQGSPATQPPQLFFSKPAGESPRRGGEAEGSGADQAWGRSFEARRQHFR